MPESRTTFAWKNRVSVRATRARLHAALLAAGVACAIGPWQQADAGIVVGDEKTQSLPLGAVVPDSSTVGVVFPPSHYRYPGYAGYGYGYGYPYGSFGAFGYYGREYFHFNPDRAYRRHLRADQIGSMRELRRGRR